VRRSWAAVTVGILVVVVLAASYKLVRSVDERPAEQGYAVWALFRDASSLFEKSRVQTAGITVGQIESRKLDIQAKRARITIRMLPKITLYENATVSKKSASLLGEYYLEIDPGSAIDTQGRPQRELHDGDQIKVVHEPTGMADVMEDVGTLLPILRDILEDVRKLTSGTISNIAENVNDLIETNSEVLERLLNSVDRIAANVESVTSSEAGDVKESIKNVRNITESIKSLIGTTQGEVTGTSGAMRSSLDKLQSTLDSLDHSMKNVEKITTVLEKGEGTVGHLLKDDTIAQNVEDITEDASTLVRNVTKLQTIVGLRTEYSLISSTFKNYLSIQLTARPDKFYLIELVEDPRGFREMTTTVTNFSQTGTSSQDTVTISERLRFTLMFGKRIGPVAGRFGLEESTGGLGADLFLFNDRLSLSMDLFDARTNQYPRLKATLRAAIWERRFFVVAGGDDLINLTRARAGGGGGIDYFIGAQLVFNDEDLKALLLFGAGAAAGAASK